VCCVCITLDIFTSTYAVVPQLSVKLLLFFCKREHIQTRTIGGKWMNEHQWCSQLLMPFLIHFSTTETFYLNQYFCASSLSLRIHGPKLKFSAFLKTWFVASACILNGANLWHGVGKREKCRDGVKCQKLLTTFLALIVCHFRTFATVTGGWTWLRGGNIDHLARTPELYSRYFQEIKGAGMRLPRQH
jgi:hypothetical protein